MSDPEIDAMLAVANAFEPLEADARRRILRWAADKYGVKTAGAEWSVDGPNQSPPQFADPRDGGVASEGDEGGREYRDFADFYDAARPSSIADKALVAAYWAQEFKGQKEFGSQALNKDLKDLGHRIPRINDALSFGMKARPALVLQVRKSGNSSQARKTYKLSAEGIKVVERMLTRDEQ